jgi:glycine/D-amino acid oxidase-like deaminating enzyme
VRICVVGGGIAGTLLALRLQTALAAASVAAGQLLSTLAPALAGQLRQGESL